MKLATFFLLITFYLLLFNPILAQSSASASSSLELTLPTKESEILDVGRSKIGPQSPLYFLKTIRANIEYSLASSKEAKTHWQQEFAHRRLRELNSAIDAKREDLIEPTLEKYHFNMLEAGEHSTSQELILQTTQNLALQLNNLIGIQRRASEPNSKRAILANLALTLEEDQRLASKLKNQALDSDSQSFQQFACWVLRQEQNAGYLNQTQKAEIKLKAEKCLKNITH